MAVDTDGWVFSSRGVPGQSGRSSRNQGVPGDIRGGPRRSRGGSGVAPRTLLVRVTPVNLGVLPEVALVFTPTEAR